MKINDTEKWRSSSIGEWIELEYGRGLPVAERVAGPITVFGSNGAIGKHDRALVKGPGIIIGRKGSIGGIIYSNGDFWPIDTTYYVSLKRDSEIKFWYYFLKTLGIDKMNSHSAVPGLNRNEVYEIVASIPPISEQKQISAILSSLDDKIELNRQMNATLERITQTLFHHWFVEFEFPDEKGRPYKSSGGKMIWDEEMQKELPDGWGFSSFSMLCRVTSGKRPSEISGIKTKEYPIPVYGASKIMGYTRDSLFTKSILITGRVGTHGIIQRVATPSYPSDNTLVIITEHTEFIYRIMKTFDYNSMNIGSTQPLITQTALLKQKIILPSRSILKKYEATVTPMSKRMYSNNSETEFLERLRDLLLPKLMSGEIRVPKWEDQTY